MKKIFFGLCVAAGMLTACDPSVDSISAPASNLTTSVLESEFSFKQYHENDDGTLVEAADGNIFKFNVGSPYKSVVIYTVDEEGVQNILASGFSGQFTIKPKRGANPNQTFFVRAADKDGTKVEIKKDVVVYVPTELSQEMKFLCSEGGIKTWTWDTEFREDGGAWGNLGYAPGDGKSFVESGNGIWWGCPPADLTGQLNHSETGVATGEEDPNAYMIFNFAKNTIKSFDGSGKEIRNGTYEIMAWNDGIYSSPSADGSQPEWAQGYLVTSPGAILFPFQINNHNDGHDNTIYPTTFEIMQLDGNHLKLIYPQAGTGGWTEATWWAFKKK